MAAPCLIASEKRTARLYRWSWVFGDTEWTLTFSSNPRQTKQESWRREWDSNPRYGFPYTRFPSVRLKPLGHPSGSCGSAGNIVVRDGAANPPRCRYPPGADTHSACGDLAATASGPKPPEVAGRRRRVR